MSEISTANQENARKPLFGRWWQLLFGIICMSMIANLQYGWTLFVNPIDERYEWGRAAIQVAFTIFVLTETWLVPIEGYLVDKFGPRIVVVISSVLVGVSWVMNSMADSLPMLYAAAAIGGIGAGAVYGTCVGNALKWFPDRRGLAPGSPRWVSAPGSALTIIPIATMIRRTATRRRSLFFGLWQGIVVFILGLVPRRAGPRIRLAAAPSKAVSAVTAPAREYAPLEMIRTPVFWVMYTMFVLMATGGLMATAQLAPIARDFQSPTSRSACSASRCRL